MIDNEIANNMEPVYVDVHIHTSDNPDSLNQNYDIESLFAKVREQAQGQHALISLTDHNTINKKAYLDAMTKCEPDIHLLLGVELHIHYLIDTEAYHCHIFFKDNISAQEIDNINKVYQLWIKSSMSLIHTISSCSLMVGSRTQPLIKLFQRERSLIR